MTALKPKMFFVFMQFSVQIGQVVGWHPPSPSGWRIPLGNPGYATVKYLSVNRKEALLL